MLIQIVIGPVKIDHVSTKNHRFLVCLLYHNLITIYVYYCNKIFITTAVFHGLSSAAYGNGIVRSERKILAKIELGVICAHMVDFRRRGHN